MTGSSYLRVTNENKEGSFRLMEQKLGKEQEKKENKGNACNTEGE